MYIVYFKPKDGNDMEIFKYAFSYLKENRFEEISTGVFITTHSPVKVIVTIQKLYKGLPDLLDITEDLKMLRVEESTNLLVAVSSIYKILEMT